MSKKTSNELEQAAVLSFPGDGRKAPVQTVAMTRDPVYGGPTTADVHPDEVANWQANGWVIAE